MGIWLSLSCAVVAALGYGIGSVVQAAAARRIETSAHLDAMLLVRLVRQLPYVAGLGLDLLGFFASAVALRQLPLFVVQSAVASSVGVTALGASIAFGVVLLRYERVALVALVIGFALLAISARPEHATALGTFGKSVLVAGIVVVVAAGAISVRLSERAASIGLALGAGLSWAGTGIAARVLEIPSPVWRLVLDPVAWSLVVYGVLGALLFASALQRGSVTAAAALVFLVETLVPSLIGIAFLGDATRSGFAPVAALGFVTAVGASVALARRSEPLPLESEPST